VARRGTVVFAALAAVDTILAAAGRDRPRRLTKPLLMPVLMAGRDRPAQRALALGGGLHQRPGTARRAGSSRRPARPAVLTPGLRDADGRARTGHDLPGRL
jgi:hypothetical protein